MDPAKVRTLVKWFNALGSSLQIQKGEILRQFAKSAHFSAVLQILTKDEFPVSLDSNGHCVFASLISRLDSTLPRAFTSKLDEERAENGDAMELVKFMTLSLFAIQKKQSLADKVKQVIAVHLTDDDITEVDEIISSLEQSDGSNWPEIVLMRAEAAVAARLPVAPAKATNHCSVELPSNPIEPKPPKPPKKRPHASTDPAEGRDTEPPKVKKKAPKKRELAQTLKEAQSEVERLRSENEKLREQLKTNEERFKGQFLLTSSTYDFEIRRLLNVVDAHQRQRLERESLLCEYQRRIVELEGAKPSTSNT